ncbi:MAG: alpha/beta hydrolase [Chitinophagaceae bacterium]
MTQKSITIKNKEVFYSTAGTGFPVVLIHGFAEDSAVWKYQLDELSKHFLLIVPDLPGSGKSAIADDMSIEGLADCVKQIIDQELQSTEIAGKAPGSVIIIGHSMGGYITLALVEKHPNLIAGFGLFHSSAFADNEEKKKSRRKSIDFILSHGTHAFIKQSAPNLFTEAYRIKNSMVVEDMIDRYSHLEPMALVAYYEAMINRPDRTALLASFNNPILFIIGKQDKAIPFTDSMQQCHIPQLSTIEILEDSAHMGMWEEKEKSSQALLLFLKHVQQSNLH